MTHHLGEPLALLTATGVCDRNPEHEIRVITDGHRAYAYGLDAGAADAVSVERREGGMLAVECGQDRGYLRCDGIVWVDLATDAWVPAEGDDLGFLLAHGTVIA